MAKQGNDSAAPAEAAAAADASKPVHVMDLLKQFDFLSIGLKGKIHCALTNRDLPLNSVAIQQHVNSKKLKKEREWYNADFSKYEPFIVAHKTHPKLLFCKLTHIELNRIPKQVEAHVNGKRYRNRKAEMDGLKQAQRQPLREGSEEESEKGKGEGGDGPGFWAPTGGAQVEDMDENDTSDEEGEEEDDEEEVKKVGQGAGAVGGSAPRRAKANDSKAGTRKGGGQKGGREGDKPKEALKGGCENDSDGRQENGASGGEGGAKGKKRKQKGSAKNKKQAGKGAAKSLAKKGESSPMSEDTPATRKSATKDAASSTALLSPSVKKIDKKEKSTKKGGLTPGGEEVVEGSTSARKRKHKVSEEPPSNGKKKRKG
ncbi:unnamed protein product [Pylaiella littoralis]